MPLDKESVLDEIFADADPHGMLSVKAPTRSATTDDRLLARFQEINAFVAIHDGREPSLAGTTLEEKLLATALKSFRDRPEQAAQLGPYDEHGLLKAKTTKGASTVASPPRELNSLDDIFADDNFDLLDDDAPDLHTLRHVPVEKSEPDFVARRKPCKDFAEFEPLFKACHADLRTGKRRFARFKNTQELEAGQFHVLKGVMLYIAEVGERHIRGSAGDYDARTRTIYENGTESSILIRSLASALYADGKRITYHEDRVLDELYHVRQEDRPTGYIYVLRSLSTDPAISVHRDLYKIGFSSGPIEQRIRNAAKEPTYLMADVEIVGGWQCFNMNTQKLEGLLHNFFGNSCLDVQIAGPDGRYHQPREWFIAPLGIIEQVVPMMISGEVVKYRYDAAGEGIAWQ